MPAQAIHRFTVQDFYRMNDNTIEVYREPHFLGYASKTDLQTGDHAKPAACPYVGVHVAELLRR